MSDAAMNDAAMNDSLSASLGASLIDEAWDQLRRRWLSGEPCGLATVVSTYGSAPRRPGSIMVRTPDGAAFGSVSGGCVEGAVYALAEQVVQDGVPVLERYGVSDDDAAAVGLTCGGTIDVFVRRVDPGSAPELGVLFEHLRSGTAVALATVVASAEPARCGRQLVCFADGTEGGTGSPVLDAEIARTARRFLARGSSGDFRTEDGSRVFVNCLEPAPRMLVYGANEFASALVRQGVVLGFRVTVCDARGVFTTRERFPDAHEVVVDWPHRHLAAELAAGRVDARTAVVSLTHDPKFEIPLLEIALRQNLAYVGAMGSRRTVAQRRASLRSVGILPRELARLCSPVGLDLGGVSPAETALSIAAEMLLLQHGGVGSRLSETSGPIHHEPAVLT